MKKNILGKFAVMAIMLASLVCSASVQRQPIVTNATSADFDCAYGVNDLSDPFIANGYGSTEVITYTEEEATAAGIPAGFSGDVVSVLNKSINRGIMLDFSSQNIPIQLVDSITFRVYVGDDGITDGYPELRIPEPHQNGGWVMRYAFADKTDAWQEIVLKDDNGSFFNNGSRTANFNMLAKDGYLYKLEFAVRHNGSSATFYIDSVELGFIDNDGVAPVLTYNGEDVVTIAKGQKLNFDVSAKDALEGEMDVEYVWADPSKIEADGTPMAGTHTLTFVSRDFFGNIAEKSITVVVVEPDLIPPTLVVPLDTVYAKIGARSLLTFEATDNNGEVDVDLIWSEGALDRYERLTEGTHTLTVVATDLSGNQTQAVITFIVTAEGDTADVVIDEEALCTESVEPESSEETSSNEEPESSEEVSSSSKESSSIKDSSSSKDSVSSEKPVSSEEPATSESSEVSASDSEQQDDGILAKLGCGGALGVMGGLPVLALACVLLKKKED